MAETPTVDALLARWIDAFNRHDLDDHMALYLDEAVLFGAVDELQVGKPAIRAYFAGRGPQVRVIGYPMPRVLELGPDTVCTAGHVEFADGDTPMPYRMTWVLVRRGGHWRIAQHHGSPRRGT